MSIGPRVSGEFDQSPAPIPPPMIFLGSPAAALGLNRLVPRAAPWAEISRILSVLAVVVGVWLVGAAFSQLVKRQTSIDPRGAATPLVADGPYRFRRNPIHLGLTLGAGTLWGLIAGPLRLWGVTHLVIGAEESHLGSKVNGAFADYRSRVGGWL